MTQGPHILSKFANGPLLGVLSMYDLKDGSELFVAQIIQVGSHRYQADVFVESFESYDLGATDRWLQDRGFDTSCQEG